VPAFVGLGAPHWAPGSRGLICGLTLDATPAHLARAALESVAYQTLDLMAAMARDGARPPQAIRVDGGMAANDWFCQFLADILEVRVERPAELETTALGAAFLAGLATGVWPSPQSLASTWSAAAAFTPSMANERRRALIAGWRQALERTLLGAQPS
jgi:glycerol kinase